MPLTGNVKADIHEMSHSSGHKKRVKKHGRETAHKMEVAAAARTHAEKKGKRKPKKAASRHSGRH